MPNATRVFVAWLLTLDSSRKARAKLHLHLAVHCSRRRPGSPAQSGANAASGVRGFGVSFCLWLQKAEAMPSHRYPRAPAAAAPQPGHSSSPPTSAKRAASNRTASPTQPPTPPPAPPSTPPPTLPSTPPPAPLAESLAELSPRVRLTPRAELSPRAGLWLGPRGGVCPLAELPPRGGLIPRASHGRKGSMRWPRGANLIPAWGRALFWWEWRREVMSGAKQTLYCAGSQAHCPLCPRPPPVASHKRPFSPGCRLRRRWRSPCRPAQR